MLNLKIQLPNGALTLCPASIAQTGQQLKESLGKQNQIKLDEFDLTIMNGQQYQPLQLNFPLLQQGITEYTVVKLTTKQFNQLNRTAQLNAAYNQMDQNQTKLLNQQLAFNPQNPISQHQFNQPIIQPQFAPSSNPGYPAPPHFIPPSPSPFSFPPALGPGPSAPFFPNMMPTISPDQNLLKKQIDEKNKEIDEKNREIEDLKAQIEKLKKKIRELEGEDLEREQRLNTHTNNISYLESQLDNLTRQNKIFKRQIQENNLRINELEIQVDEQANELSDKDNQIKKQQDKLLRATNAPITDFNTIKQNNDEELSKLRKKNNALQKEIQGLKAQLIQQEEGVQASQQIIQEQEMSNEKVEQLKKEMEEMKQQMKTMNQKIEELKHNAFVEQKKREDREAQIEKLKKEVQTAKQEYEFKQQELEQNKKMIQFLEDNVRKIAVNRNVSAIDSVQNDFAKMQARYQQERQQEEKKKQEEKQQNEQKQMQQAQHGFQERQQNIQRQQMVAQEEKKIKAVKLREAIMSKQGVLQVGLLIDVTGSMDQYKDATMNVIDKVMKTIKDQTNRDCEWGSVCYQDFAELKQMGQYYQHQFTKDQNQIMKFLKNIKCDGGDDGAEDLRGGIKQMVKNLPWEKSFKIALLICDAPSHGQKWAGNVLDDHKDEDLTDALKMLIDKNIILIGIEFDSRTDIMFQEMKAFYAAQKKPQNLITISLKNLKPDQIQDGLIKIISEVSVTVTEVKQTGTKTKVQREKTENRDGAFEALVKKLPDPSKFTQDPNIELMDSTFEVFRVEIKQQSFDLNFQQIYNLKVPQDYTVQKESQWNCVRTKKPFAFGQLKAVYLMKKKEAVNSNEVYVIKMPIGDKTYSSIDEALKECRSHLISQKLMQKFISDLQAAPNPENLRIPEIRYSDFLILKENNYSFWIAERFFQGQFLKYNNNNGYINSEQSDLNILAQTFTFYTYHISDFNYMISDVQGVGVNFTDPAISTTTGKFDETDMGEEGMGNYIVSFEASKNKYMKYLKMLNLDQF